MSRLTEGDTSFERSLNRAYWRGREEFREEVIKLIQGCIEVDESLVKLIDAVEDLE